MVGELKGLGMTVSATTVRAWLRAAGLGPAGKCRETTWREFIRAHRQSLLAVDFFTVETLWLQRLYILFFIELGSRRVHVAGCTSNPNAPWVIQQARHLSWALAERAEPIRFLIRDRDQKFTDRFDDVFRSEGGGRSDAVSRTTSQWSRRAIRAHRPLRVFRQAADSQPAAPGTGPTGVHRSLQWASATSRAVPHAT
jgi:hypothetical protein